MLTWKTGCVSALSPSLLEPKSDHLWFHMVPIRETRPLNFCFLHLHNMCFHLGSPCQYVSGTQYFYKSSDMANQLNPKCVCVFVQPWLCDLWGEIAVVGGVGLAQLGSGDA